MFGYLFIHTVKPTIHWDTGPLRSKQLYKRKTDARAGKPERWKTGYDESGTWQITRNHLPWNGPLRARGPTLE